MKPQFDGSVYEFEALRDGKQVLEDNTERPDSFRLI